MMFVIHKVLQDMEKSLARNKIYPYTKIWGFYHELNDIIFSNLVLSQHLKNAASKKKRITGCHYAAAAAKSCQSCPTLCNPIDGSPPGSSVPGILQARTLEWVAVSFFNA